MKKWIFLVIAIFIFGLVGLGYFFLFTTQGARLVIDRFANSFFGREGFAYERVEGNFVKGVTFRKIELKEIEDLPKGHSLKVQDFFVRLRSFDTKGIDVIIDNFRLKLPDCDPIVLSGQIQDGQFDFNVYSKNLDVNKVAQFFPQLLKLRNVTGHLDDADLFIRGNFDQPLLTGNLMIQRLNYKGITVANVPTVLDFKVRPRYKQGIFSGEIIFQGGTVMIRRTLVNIDPSRVAFHDDIQNPTLNLKGRSVISKVKISIRIQGTKNKPELTLSSDPVFLQEKLLVMLATGKSWDGVEGALREGVVTADVARDFVDYFVFAGTGDGLAKRLGLSDVSLKYDDEGKGISLKKDFLKKIELGYGVEEKNAVNGTGEVSQKIGGKVNVTDSVSVGAEREVRQSVDKKDLLDNEAIEAEDKVYLEYKKRF